MARTDWNFSFSMSYEMKFKAAIRGHHVYKATWSSLIKEVLTDFAKKATVRRLKKMTRMQLGFTRI